MLPVKVILKVIANSVPAICLVLGFLDALLFHDPAGWIIVLIGVGLQILFLRSNRRA
jgi:uncharacterized membrane protein YedE/YeeE